MFQKKDEKVKANQAPKVEDTQELKLDDLKNVTGGSLRNAPKVKTTSISSDTKGKI